MLGNRHISTAMMLYGVRDLLAPSDLNVAHIVRGIGLADADAAVFAECSAGRTVTMPFACRSQIKAMNSCLKA